MNPSGQDINATDSGVTQPMPEMNQAPNETPAMPEVETPAPEQVTTGADFETNTPVAVPVAEPEPIVEPEPVAPEASATEPEPVATEEPAVEPVAEPAPVAPEEPAVEPVAEPAPVAPEEPAVEPVAEPAVEEPAEEKPPVGAAAVAHDLQENAALDSIKPMEQNLTAEQANPVVKASASPANTILIVLIVLSALVLAASLIALFVVG